MRCLAGNRLGLSMIGQAGWRSGSPSSQVSVLRTFLRTCECVRWPQEAMYVRRRRLCWSLVRTWLERVCPGLAEFRGGYKSLTCDDGSTRVQKCRSAAEPGIDGPLSRGWYEHRRCFPLHTPKIHEPPVTGGRHVRRTGDQRRQNCETRGARSEHDTPPGRATRSRSAARRPSSNSPTCSVSAPDGLPRDRLLDRRGVSARRFSGGRARGRRALRACGCSPRACCRSTVRGSSRCSPTP